MLSPTSGAIAASSFSLEIGDLRAERVVVRAGQTPPRPGDMRRQLLAAVDALENTLRHSGYELSDVVRLTYYTTDVSAFLGAHRALGARLAARNCQPASALHGVARLGAPESLVEIEATAVR